MEVLPRATPETLGFRQIFFCSSRVSESVGARERRSQGEQIFFKKTTRNYFPFSIQKVQISITILESLPCLQSYTKYYIFLKELKTNITIVFYMCCTVVDLVTQFAE